ncbi:MAG: acyl-CoA carboxylase subunit epsilon [Trebonia sp.]
MTTAHAGQPAGQPVITVTRGPATPAEIAAVMAVLLSVRTPAAVAPVAESARPSLWADGARARVALPRPGPHSWRASALPR